MGGRGWASVETSPSAVEDLKSSTLSRGKHLPVYWPYMEEKKLKQTEGKQFSPIKEHRYLYVELLHPLHIAAATCDSTLSAGMQYLKSYVRYIKYWKHQVLSCLNKVFSHC